MKDMFNLDEEFKKRFGTSITELEARKKELFEVSVNVWEKLRNIGEKFVNREILKTYARDYEDAEDRAIDFLRVKYPEKLFKLTIDQSINLEEF